MLFSWASPSVIRSCAKLRYSDAQKMLEDDALTQPADVSIHGDHAWESVRTPGISSQHPCQPDAFRCSRYAYAEHLCRVLVHTAVLCMQVAADVRHLHGLAQRIRARRTAGGSLRLDNVKLGFQLNDAGEPVSTYTQERR